MPRKIRQLKADLRAAGFVERTDRGKGSHVVWVYAGRRRLRVTLSGQDGDDAKPYQEKDIREAIAKAVGSDGRAE